MFGLDSTTRRLRYWSVWSDIVAFVTGELRQVGMENHERLFCFGKECRSVFNTVYPSKTVRSRTRTRLLPLENHNRTAHQLYMKYKELYMGLTRSRRLANIYMTVGCKWDE